MFKAVGLEHGQVVTQVAHILLALTCTSLEVWGSMRASWYVVHCFCGEWGTHQWRSCSLNQAESACGGRLPKLLLCSDLSPASCVGSPVTCKALLGPGASLGCWAVPGRARRLPCRAGLKPNQAFLRRKTPEANPSFQGAAQQPVTWEFLCGRYLHQGGELSRSPSAGAVCSAVTSQRRPVSFPAGCYPQGRPPSGTGETSDCPMPVSQVGLMAPDSLFVYEVLVPYFEAVDARR